MFEKHWVKDSLLFGLTIFSFRSQHQDSTQVVQIWKRAQFFPDGTHQ